MEWTPRTIADAEYQHPYRYALKDINTGDVIATYDIVPTWIDNQSEVVQKGTEINSSYLQPIEDFLKAISDDLTNFGIAISSVDSKLVAAESAADSRIDAASVRVNAVESSLATKAPLIGPTLTDPTANTVAISSNSNKLATTSAVYTYLNSLMSAYRG